MVSTRMHFRHTTAWRTLIASVVVLIAVGCTATADFVDGIALYPGSTAAGARTEKDGVLTQSFTVQNAVPEQILSHFIEFLPDWTAADPVNAGTALRLELTAADGRRLEVSSTAIGSLGDPADARPSGVDPTVQYSLILHPA